MDKKILLQNLADSLAERTGMTKRKAEAFVRSFFEVTEEAIANDGQVKVKGFGTTKIVNVSDRESVDINTGERIQIEGHAKVTFTPDTLFRDLVNRPFAHFTTIVLDDDVTDIEEGEAPTATLEGTGETEEASETTEEETPVVEEETPETKEEEPEAKEEEPVAKEEEAAEEVPEAEPEVQSEAEPEAEPEVQQTQETIIAPAVIQEETEDAPFEDEEEEPIPTLDEAETATTTVESSAQKSPIIINNTIPAPRHNWWKTAFLLLAMLIITLVSYFAGYFRIFCPCNIIGTDAETITVAETEHITADSVAKAKSDSLAKAKADSANAAAQQVAEQLAQQQAAAQAATEKLAAQQAAAEEATKRQSEVEAAKRYEQIPGSNYLITGTMQTRRIKTGENLYKIARQMYGHKDFARYIAFYNNIEDPNHVCIGQTIKLPSLTRR